MQTAIASNFGFTIRLALAASALSLAVIGIAPADMPLIGDLLSPAHAARCWNAGDWCGG